MSKRRVLTGMIVGVLVALWFVATVSADFTYIVQPGDTLSGIAQRFDVSMQEIIEANNIVNPNFIYVGQELIIPSDDGGPPPPSPTGTAPPPDPTGTPPPPGGDCTFTYTVQAGDTLARIALRFNVPIGEIIALNGIANPNFIYVGQQLLIPDSDCDDGTPPPPTSTPPPPTGTVPPPDPTSTPPPPGGDCFFVYTVQPGDTLSSIARDFGVSVTAIAEANGITNPNFIYVGQVLQIPDPNCDGGGTPPPPTSTPPPPTGTAPPPTATAPPPTATAPPPDPTQPPPPSSNFELGGQTHTLANPDLMADLGMVWVKFQHKWNESDSPNVIAGRISDAHARGFKVLMSMPGANTYPDSINFAGYVDFLAGVAALPDPPDAIEVWNEMNIDFEWPVGEISPQQYVDEMLMPAYQRIKAANSNIMVISGALAPTGADNGSNVWADDRYLAGMAAAGAVNWMDCVGVHHNAGATSPNDTTGHPGGSHYSWYFWPTFNLYYNAFGGAKPLCYTEIGYVTGEDFGGSLPPNFAWANGTSLAEHAQWLGEAVTLSAQSGNVDMMIIFNVDFTHYDPNGDPQAGYALIRPNGSCPACDPIRNAMGR